MGKSYGKRSQKIWMEIPFSKQSRKHNLQPFSWGNDNPLPSLVTSEIPMRIFLVSLPSQLSLILAAKSRCQTPLLSQSPWPTLRMAARDGQAVWTWSRQEQ